VDRLDALAVFVAIVEEGSLAAAGRKLRRSPPAVTRALAMVEERAGARLLDRTTRRSRPTDVGKCTRSVRCGASWSRARPTSSTLVRLLPEFEPPQIAVPSARQLPPRTRSFVDHARTRPHHPRRDPERRTIATWSRSLTAEGRSRTCRESPEARSGA
jgi:DNA-binding transcriptional LysR family regulator